MKDTNYAHYIPACSEYVQDFENGMLARIYGKSNRWFFWGQIAVLSAAMVAAIAWGAV